MADASKRFTIFAISAASFMNLPRLSVSSGEAIRRSTSERAEADRPGAQIDADQTPVTRQLADEPFESHCHEPRSALTESGILRPDETQALLWRCAGWGGDGQVRAGIMFGP